MKNREYWRRRFEILEQSAVNKGGKHLQTLDREYKTAMQNVEAELSKWYQRFAGNNGITLAEAKQWLNKGQLAEFKWSVDDYIKYAQENALNQQWMKQLENASTKVHVSRLQALQIEMQQKIEVLYGNQLDGIDALARKIYTDGYYHTAFEVQKGFNIGWDLTPLNQKQLDGVVSKPWTLDKETFSDRIWKQKDALVGRVQTEMTQTLLRGDSPDKAINAISKQFNVSKSQAGRLVMTESAYFASEAQKDCFNGLDVERFEIVATLDSHTSELCQSLDGHVEDMKNYEAGVTAPPFHPWCRSVASPYFDDNFGERAARGADGKTYYVPSNMKYADWKKTFVDGGKKVGLSQIDRTSIIDTIMNSETIFKFDDVHKALIKADLEKTSDVNLQIVEKSIGNLRLNADGTGGCFYSPGSGYMEMNLNKEPFENIRTFWHEYGHYIDDVRDDVNGLSLKTLETIDGRASSHTFEWFGASSRADRIHKYNTEAAIPDLQNFLDRIAPGKYEVSGERNAAIYLKGTQIQVGEQWGANYSDFSTLMDDINDGLKKQLGADDSANYLLSLGKPQSPQWSDYYVEYRTPKRQTLKSKPAFKGAEEAWGEANARYWQALDDWEKAYPNAYKEADALYQAYRDRVSRFAAITDLLDGEAHGEMGMRILWGGHDPTYFKTNSLNIDEGWANWFQMNLQNDVEMLNYLERYAPEAKRIFEECYAEMLKQTFGGG